MNENQTQRPIIIYDGMNILIRSMMANESVNANGQLVGGVLGFLKNLRYISSLFKPSKVFVVWEQGGSSNRRRKIYPEYKANRAKQKDFNNLYSDENGKIKSEDFEKNKIFQTHVLTKVLDTLPVCQLYVPEVECDDVIAWLCKGKFARFNGKKIIISSDKDFYQLLEDKNTNMFDVNKKHIVDGEYVEKTFGISANNFALARCIAGDPSDNISGVPGVGLKTISNRFKAFLEPENDLDVDWVMNESKRLQNGFKKLPKFLEGILQSEEILRRNWKLMYLDINCLFPTQVSKLEWRIENFTPKINHIDYLKIFTSVNIPITKEIDDVPSELKYLLVK